MYLAFGSVVLLFLLLILTNPTELPLVLLVMPFALLFVSIYSTTKVILRHTRLKADRKRTTIVASAIAALPVLLFVFQSVHQLTIRDILVSIALVGAAVFYISRADFIH